MSNKIKLLRILEIMQKTDEYNPLKISDVISKLSLYGIDAERKSVSRDIQTLIDGGYSILSAGKQSGYYMTDHAFEDYELKIITDAVCSAKFITKTDSFNLVNKLKSIATPTAEKILSGMMWIDDEIKTDNKSSKYTVDTIINAIKNEKKINFRYIDYNEDYEKVLRRDGHLYSVSPYYLVWNEEDYYLLGSPDSHDNLTHFQISMMVDASISDDTRKRRDDIIQLKGTFDLGKHIRENISMFTGEVSDVVLKCHNKMLRFIIRKFGKSTHISKIDDEYFRTRIRATDNDGLYQWIMQNCQNVQVISPESIRDKIKDLLSNALKEYDAKGS